MDNEYPVLKKKVQSVSLTEFVKNEQKIMIRETSYLADCLTGGEGSLPRSENGC